jgi:DNA-binding PadR family transcriptional regulator
MHSLHCGAAPLLVSAPSTDTGERGGMLRYFILGLFRSGRAYYGYALMKEYRERAGVRVSSALFYPELQRLIADGWIERTGRPDADPRRACYAITGAGAAAFDAWLGEPVDAVELYPEDELSARALFIAEAAPQEVGKQLDRWREELWFCGKMLERAREHVRAAAARDDEEFRLPLEVLFAKRLKHVAADLDFVDRFRATHAEWRRAAGAVEPRPPRRPDAVQDEKGASVIAEPQEDE